MKKPSPIFYGWFIVGAALIWMAYNSTMFVYGLSAFLTPMVLSTGWSYTQVTIAGSIRGLEIGGLDPLAGLLVEKYSARWLMMLGTIVLAGGMIIVSQSTTFAMFMVGYLVAGLGTSFCQNVVPQTIIARWFRRNIGKASGILSMGFALGGLFIPFLVTGIDALGWRDMMLYLSIGVVVLVIPIVAVFRNRPEDYGLRPDGDSAPVKEQEVAAIAEAGLTVSEAVRTREFWLIGIASLFQLGAVHACTTHVITYLMSIGFEDSTAAISVTIISMIGLAVRVLYGVLADLIGKKYVYALSNGITAAGLLIFGMIPDNSFAMMVVFGVVYGLGVSGATSLRTPIVREYFGVKKFGAIYGVLSIFTVIGGVSGAPLAGRVYDTTGSYFPVWHVYAALTGVGALLLLLLLPKPSPEATGADYGEEAVKQQLKNGR